MYGKEFRSRYVLKDDVLGLMDGNLIAVYIVFVEDLALTVVFTRSQFWTLTFKLKFYFQKSNLPNSEFRPEVQGNLVKIPIVLGTIPRRFTAPTVSQFQPSASRLIQAAVGNSAFNVALVSGILGREIGSIGHSPNQHSR